MPVLPPGGGLAICAVGKARWEVEWKKGKSKTMDWLPEDIEAGGTEAVLKCPVGWSGDHRVVSFACPRKDFYDQYRSNSGLSLFYGLIPL